MTSIVFDTHESFKLLKEAGLNDAQAEAIVKVVSRTVDLRNRSQLATPADVASPNSEVGAGITALDARIAADLSASKADIASLDTKLGARISAQTGELVWWIVGTGAVVVASNVLLNVFG